MKKNIKVSVKGVYKIFGDNPPPILDLVKAGMGKSQVLEEHNHVIGLQDINIDMCDGDITVVMGLSGSGKSTLIRHLNRLIEPTAGEIFVDDIDVLKMTPEDLRVMRQTRISMVFQKFALFPHRTVAENAGLALYARKKNAKTVKKEAFKWLDRVGLGGYEDYYPHQLSGGMQQRVGLARALTSNSEIMLMDEAFSALDPLIRSQMQDLLLELQQDLHKTIIFITHDLDEALKLADHLVILNDGYVVQQGEPQHILLNPKDSHVEDFVSGINRARVLRVRTVMYPLPENIPETAGEIDWNDTLENIIDLSGGDTQFSYLVKKETQPVGILHMKDLVRALAPDNEVRNIRI